MRFLFLLRRVQPRWLAGRLWLIPLRALRQFVVMLSHESAPLSEYNRLSVSSIRGISVYSEVIISALGFSALSFTVASVFATGIAFAFGGGGLRGSGGCVTSALKIECCGIYLCHVTDVAVARPRRKVRDTETAAS